MSGFFVFDVETLGTESHSVILSAAILYVDMEVENHTWESLYENTLFVKFNAKEQVTTYKRIVEKRVVDWWQKQCKLARDMSFVPKENDLPAKEGLSILKQYIKQHANPETTLMWVRGSLDQMAIDSLSKHCEDELIMPYANYRDVRTYVDIIATNSKRGYCDIDKTKYPDFDRNKVIKHNPIDDIVLDALMILYPN